MMPTDQENLTIADKIKKVLGMKLNVRKEPVESAKPLDETKSNSLNKKPSETKKGFFRLPNMLKRKKPAPLPEDMSKISESKKATIVNALDPNLKEKMIELDESNEKNLNKKEGTIPSKKKKWFAFPSLKKKERKNERKTDADQVQSLANIFKEIQKKGDFADADLSKLMPPNNIPNQKVALGQILKVKKIVNKVMADGAKSGEPVDPANVLNKVMASMNMPAIDKATADKILAMSLMLLKKMPPSKLVPGEPMMNHFGATNMTMPLANIDKQTADQMALLSNIFQQKITTVVPEDKMSPNAGGFDEESSIIAPPVSITSTGWDKNKIELAMIKEPELD